MIKFDCQEYVFNVYLIRENKIIKIRRKQIITMKQDSVTVENSTGSKIEVLKTAYMGNKDELLNLLDVDPKKGLSELELKQRVAIYGTNMLKAEKKQSLLSKLVEQFKDVMVILLLFATFISGLQGDWVEAIVIFAIIAVNAVLGVLQEGKAEKALEALQKMSAPQARVIRNGEQSLVEAYTLVPGDILVLEAGDIVPADARLLESSNLKAEEASLTGESVPVEKKADFVCFEKAGIGDRHNMIYSSTSLTYGRALAVVTATGINSEMGKIADKISSIEKENTPLQNALTKLGKTLAILCILICFIVFLEGIWGDLGALFKLDFNSDVLSHLTESLKISVSLAVAAVPEGLAAIVTIVLALGMKRMAERNAIVKRLLAVETLGCVDVICSDKTGTLTQNEMTVTKIYSDEKKYEVQGIGYEPEGDLLLNGEVCDASQNPALILLNKVCLYCNEAQLKCDENKNYYILGDPTEGALLSLAAKLNVIHHGEDKVFDLPFDSERKMMTCCYQNPLCNEIPVLATYQYVSFTKGAPDLILKRCDKIFTADGIRDIDESDLVKIEETNSFYASQALRVLAFAVKVYTETDVKDLKSQVEHAEENLIFVGLTGMIDPARSDAKEAIETCNRAGIRAIMITGDYKDTAAAIAKDLSLLRDDKYDGVLTGDDIDDMSDADLQKAVETTSVFARVSPEHKVRIVAALKAGDHIASMTGDGVNDAPALKQADIGVAMGITGTDVAKGAADMILTDDNFASIVSAVKEGRVIYSNIRKFVGFLLSCNVAEILVIFVCTMVFGFSPLESIQLLWLNLITDSFPALALGQEEADADIMDRKPRDKNENIINKDMIAAILVQSVSILFAVFMVFFINHNDSRDAVVAKTMAFTTLVFAELLRAYSCRSENFSVFSIGFFKNRTMVLATLLSFSMLLVVIYVPFLNTIFHTKPLNLLQWLEVIGFGIIPFIAGETYKFVKILKRKISTFKCKA